MAVVKQQQGELCSLQVLPWTVVVCLEQFPPASGDRYRAPKCVLAEHRVGRELLSSFRTGRREICTVDSS